MPDDEPARSTAEPITALIAERVRKLREDAGWTQTDLAREVAKHGPRWTRATVINLEKRASGSRGAGGGGRDAVTVRELLALALALDVPPIMLIADPRNEELIPISTSTEPIDAWLALIWLSGAGPIDHKPAVENFRRASWLVNAGLDVNEAVGALRALDRSGQERTDERHREALEKLNRALIRIDAAQAQYPPLPDFVFERADELGIEITRQEP